MKKSILCAAVLAACTSIPALADTAPLVQNAVLIDNAPFYSLAGDSIGTGNYALNHPGFIDIPYAIFDFGSTTSVSSALLTWNFDSLYGGSAPAAITLYVGNDADGLITASDRFMGTSVDTSSYSGGELRTFDITSFVNTALGGGRYVAARFEVVAAPDTLSGYHGGDFYTPSMSFTAAVPEPETYAMLLAGLGLMGTLARRRKLAA